MLPSSILKECNQFLTESNTKPLLRALPKIGDGFRKVKVRKKSRYNNPLEHYFDIAFFTKYKEIRLRSMIVQTTIPAEIQADQELFYVFPINDYKILYNPQVNDYVAYATSLRPIIETLHSAESLLVDLFEHTYESQGLEQAIDSGAEILIYNIPYYYAIRSSLYNDYKDVLTGCID